MRFFDDLDDFFAEIKKREKFVANRIKYDLPINYEIASLDIVFNGYNGDQLFVSYPHGRLFETMDKIAVFTNNDLGCGCSFTMY